MVQLSTSDALPRAIQKWFCEGAGHEYAGGDMLEPRETDIPVLFLILVLLPLVAYVLLGKWSESAKKKQRISLLAQLAAEEALRAEAMAAATVIPLVPLPKNGLHGCARCHGPATTRCAKCKSVRYCSGKCQIVHWRHVHRHECQQLEYNSSSSSPWSASNEESIHEGLLLDGNMESRCFGYDMKQPRHVKAPSEDQIHPPISTVDSATAGCMSMDTSGVPVMERRSIDKQLPRKSKRETLRREDGTVIESSEEASRRRSTYSTSYNVTPSKEAYKRNKSKESDCMPSSEEIPGEKNINIPGGLNIGQATSRSMSHGSHRSQSQNEHILDSRTDYGISSSPTSASYGTNACDIEKELTDGGSLCKGGITSSGETEESNCSVGRTSMRKSNKAKSESHSTGMKVHKSPNAIVKASREHIFSDMERKGQDIEESSRFHVSLSNAISYSMCYFLLSFLFDAATARVRETVPAPGANGVGSIGIMKMIGLTRSSKPDRLERSEVNGDRHKRVKMLFPYEEFVKFFEYEVLDLLPRGLVNCGNSCYANAVLQCLTYTKPLTIYLLRRWHTRACSAKNWCLMCELEQHVMMLRETGGPLSPGGILSHLHRINSHIGDGSQEDAHEFLRLLVTSMQSICLEGLGGEKVVDPRLQETTFIQHTFRGRLRSKVKCLRCHHESERYENFMDLTLEIFGWVESLEDALTQFTSPEDLDGENMYRCGRCGAYVRALKQLSIQEAPNILTIVLKRFQEGSYGKINKCITFPDMLDMIPFMTGTADIPPLYLLYAVVVHLDTLNASFSGHYVSYVKDLQGRWFRIDDTEIGLSTVKCYSSYPGDKFPESTVVPTSNSLGTKSLVRPVLMSQVMSEGAYILFYKRSCPRPGRACSGKPARHQAPGSAKHCTSKAPKSSIPGQSDSSCHFMNPERSSHHIPETSVCLTNHSSNGIHRSSDRNRPLETYAKSRITEFSDATSSEWSIFTSSDEASFTTESTRDSFSTVDYADACNLEPFSSIFSSLYTPEYSPHKTVSCSRFSGSKSETKLLSEGKGYVFDSFMSTQPLDRLRKGENSKQVSAPSTRPSPFNTNCDVYLRCERNRKDGPCRTSGHCCKT
ncbi:hypothetical protein RJ639_041112 [Escallonia herrerae]|uniref:ubiquitinyl hydrolase 1 n=1 Tax=Escallonia herrerae TaxID=1293975 RepID=A0AA88WGA0_9ASTE|nr:hypothetical protein RJ639_041112 [Escallonia herrerae]